MNRRQRFIEWGVEIATRYQDLLNDSAEWQAAYFANEYGAGSANELVTADFTEGVDIESIEHLDPATVASLVNVLSAFITTYESNGNNTTIRKASYGGKLD